MSALRGHAVATIEPDGTRHVRWIPDTAAERAEQESARDQTAREMADSPGGRATLGKKLHAAAMKAGALYRFDMHHWQLRRDGRVVLDFWTKARGKASWRFADSETRKGSMLDLAAVLASPAQQERPGE